MIVWLVMSYHDHPGGSVESVWGTKEKALSEADEKQSVEPWEVDVVDGYRGLLEDLETL